MVLELDAHNYRLKIDPQHGATLWSAEWCHPNGAWVSLIEPLDDPQAGLKAGCFVMAPFANRIDGGRFVMDGETVQLPINAPDEGMAIHGFSRNRQWECVKLQDNHAILTDTVASQDHPYNYRLEQEISILPHGFRVALSIRNDGSKRLPFGIGLHPWFTKTPAATLEFSAMGAPKLDARGLPQGAPVPVSGFELDHSKPLSALPLINCCFSGWNSREAFIRWPEKYTALTLKAEGALKHLHVFNPQDRAVFCAEPVSHLPDAINRAELGPDAAMKILSPGESLSGGAIFSASALKQGTTELFSGGN
ncbi:aldose epimerase family protein [Brucella thiophenivorans]|uniref:Aldose 1-epimerase family protein n=1 Tax=Brucella thiophenivorans TaxID=571255 RepID=A0A256F0Q3_9HYPH|nr:hypothetical protein [Brucella thiophenivorans]OYR07981.1 aldose 1-epimerase family protein [Brucella thiophenivorans]